MYTIIHEHLSTDTVETFEQLLAAAKAAQINGGVLGLTMKGRRIFVHSFGILARDPILARGIVATLDDELSAMVQSRTDSRTTI
jgi:hypothetical protein